MRQWNIPDINERSYRYLIPDTSLADDDNYVFDMNFGGVSVREALHNNMPLQAIAVLHDVNLINHLKIKFEDNSDLQYIIEVSTDKVKWDTIVDYSNYRCHGKQEIYFTPMPVKYVKIIDRNIIRLPLRDTITENSNSSSIIIAKIIEFVMSLDRIDPFPMSTDPIPYNFLIPNYDIAPECKGPGKEGNYTISRNIKLNTKYNKPFKGNMDDENSRGQYLLQLPQPCYISKVVFRTNDRGHRIKRYHYKIEGSLSGPDDGFQWNTLRSISDNLEGYAGEQILSFDPMPMSFIRIVPTQIFNYDIRRVFSIIDFQCYGH
jgi:hypothetical protein